MPPIRTALLCTCSLRAARPPGQLLLVLFEGSPSQCVRRGLMVSVAGMASDSLGLGTGTCQVHVSSLVIHTATPTKEKLLSPL